MSQIVTIHATHPQPRLIAQVVAVLTAGGVVILPTDSGYALCCALEQKNAMERICRLRNLDPKHFFSLFCRDFSEVAHYARVDNLAFRLLKANTPAPVTFILEATREVPRRLLQPTRRTIGIRISPHPVLGAILAAFAEPLMTVSVVAEELAEPTLNPQELFEQFGSRVDMLVDAGELAVTPTTVVDLTKEPPLVVRQGSYQLM